MGRPQKGSWAPIGHHEPPLWAPRAGPRLPFGDALAPKAVPELPQEGPGAKLTKFPPKLTKFRLMFFVNLGQVFVNLGGEHELQRWAMNDWLLALGWGF